MTREKGLNTGRFRWALLVFVAAAVLLGHSETGAQVQETNWSRPYRLSTAGRRSSEAYLAADPYGYVHAFWSEELNETRQILQYARFDGTSWSLPVDLRVGVPYADFSQFAPVVDSVGMLHLMWSEGQAGPVYYTQSPAHQTLSLPHWQKPVRMNLPAKEIRLQVSDSGALQIMYSNISEQEAGVYYTRSEDGGITYSDPIWLDPDIPANSIPSTLTLQDDGAGGLHATWFYVRTDIVSGDWLRYSRSLDGGKTWSQPVTLAKDQEDQGFLNSASPIMIANGDEVHVLWAEGDQANRSHRFSEDRGETWSEPRQVFGNLNGQAFEGLTLDGLGRIHYFGQIRYPQGIYHAIWDDGAWSAPMLIYLISANASDPIGNRIHAHHTHPVIRAGNQIVLTFADSPPEPDRRLFTMIRTLDDVPALTLSPTPMPTPTPALELSPTPTPVASPTPEYLGDPAFREPGSITPGRALWIGIAASFLLVGGILLIWNFIRGRL